MNVGTRLGESECCMKDLLCKHMEFGSIISRNAWPRHSCNEIPGDNHFNCLLRFSIASNQWIEEGSALSVTKYGGESSTSSTQCNVLCKMALCGTVASFRKPLPIWVWYNKTMCYLMNVMRLECESVWACVCVYTILVIVMWYLRQHSI